jgi:hypothetical protein
MEAIKLLCIWTLRLIKIKTAGLLKKDWNEGRSTGVRKISSPHLQILSVRLLPLRRGRLGGRY